MNISYDAYLWRAGLIHISITITPLFSLTLYPGDSEKKHSMGDLLATWGYRDETLKADINFSAFPQSPSQSCMRGDRYPGNTAVTYAAASGG